MFIKSSVNTTIKDRKKALLFNIPNGYIGPIPKWVEENWYFKSLCADGKISFVDKNVTDSKLEQIDKRTQERNVANEKRILEQKEMDENINEAISNAENEIADQNLDAESKKNFVKQEVEKALSQKKK